MTIAKRLQGPGSRLPGIISKVRYSHMTVLTSIVFFDSHGGPQKSSTRLLKQAVYVNSGRLINEMEEMPFHQLEVACQKRPIIRFDAF